MEEKYIISKENLNKILSEQSKVLVGICMRRFEVLENENASKSIEERNYRKVLKKLIKEQIYEHFRTLRSLIITFSSGVKFKNEEPKQN